MNEGATLKNNQKQNLTEITIPIYYFTNKKTKQSVIDEVSMKRALEKKIKELRKNDNSANC
jgi:hypothetical protein